MSRRIVEIAVAVLLLLLLSPLLLLIAVAIMLDSPGNCLYLARRVGKGGRDFRMWKFRTMVAGADRLGSPVTGRNDPRVTRLGRFLRRTKLDELPQFVNVLLGDMALVGPRPEAPEIVALYTASQRAVLRVKPGLTGPVQFEAGCEESTIPDKVPADQYYREQLLESKLRRDLEYLETRTPATDARIVFATAMYMLRRLRPN